MHPEPIFQAPGGSHCMMQDSERQYLISYLFPNCTDDEVVVFPAKSFQLTTISPTRRSIRPKLI